MLGGFEIHPRGTIREGDRTAKGYLWESFKDAWDRYLVSRPLSDDIETSQPSQLNNDVDLGPLFQTSQEPIVTDEKRSPVPHKQRVVTNVTDQTPPEGLGTSNTGLEDNVPDILEGAI
jgi:hypothetical protein